MSGGSTKVRLASADAGPVLQARKTLLEFGRADDAAVIDRSLQGAAGPPVVVVVGEVKRGKSTLVNALAGVPVSPTGADLPTTGTVAVVPPTPALPAGSAQLVFTDRTEVVSAAQGFARLAAGGGTPLEAPLAARVAVESRWLPGAALVDTPGVGGLDSAHGRIARLAAADAAALLFVTDGGQPLTAAELDFLREVSGRVEHVVLALTKVDRNPGGWEQVREENRALLARHAPRFAGHEIHPVSAVYAMHALTQAPGVAARLEDASGLGPLAEALRGLAADRWRLAVANALRCGLSSLERLEAAVELEARAVTDTAVVLDLEAERARLAGLQLRQRRGRLDLERDLGRVRQAAVQYTGDRADDIVARLSGRIKQQKLGMTRSAREQFAAELQAELGVLAVEVRAFTEDRLTGLVAQCFESLGEAPELPGAVSAQWEGAGPGVRSRPRHALNPLLDPALAGTAFTGSRLAALLGLAAVAGPAGPLVGGAAMVAVTLGLRAVRQGQQELAGMLQESITAAKQDLVTGIDACIRELRPELQLALEDHLKASMAAVRGILDEAHRAAQQDEAARRETVERLRLRQQAVAGSRTAVQQRLLELSPGDRCAPSAVPPGIN